MDFLRVLDLFVVVFEFLLGDSDTNLGGSDLFIDLLEFFLSLKDLM
jgi:hypothetical protein